MDFCLRAGLKDGLVFAQRQVLEDEDVFETTWGYWKFRDKLVFEPTGIVVCKMLRLGRHLSPVQGSGHVQQAGWRARYQVLADGFLQIFDFSDLTPEEYSFTDLPLTEAERDLPVWPRRYIGPGSECQRLEAAKQLGEKVQLSPGLELRMEEPPTKKRKGLHHILPCVGLIGPLTGKQEFKQQHRGAMSSWPKQIVYPETPQSQSRNSRNVSTLGIFGQFRGSKNT